MITKALLLAMVGCLTTGGLAPALARNVEGGRAQGIEIGQAFPTIILPSLADGSPASIAQFRGQKVVLHIFASW